MTPQRGATPCAALIDGTNHDRDRGELPNGLPFGQPLGAERQAEIDTGLQTGHFFQDRLDQSFGGIGRHRALQDDQVAGPQVLADGPGRGLNVVDDGLIVRAERGADGDDDEVVIGDDAEVGRGAKAATLHARRDKLTQSRLRHTRPALVDLADNIRSHVDTCHGPPAVRHHGTDHRADIAEAHDRDPRPHATDQEINLGVASSERASNHAVPTVSVPGTGSCQPRLHPRLTAAA